MAKAKANLPWLVEVLNSHGESQLRDLVMNLCELNYGEVNLETAGKVNDAFRRISASPCLLERNGKLSIVILPREGDTVFQTEALDVVDLARFELLDHIHQCSRPRCSRWFISEREGAPYTLKKPCSDRCRNAIRRQKQEVKDERAAYMRRRYHDEIKESLEIKKRGLKNNRKRAKRAA